MARKPVAGPTVIDQCLEVKLDWGLTGGRAWINVLHCVLSNVTVDAALANSIMSAIMAQPATTAFLAALGSTVNFFSVRVKDVRQANLAEYQSTSGGGLGTGTGSIVSLNDALVVTLRTAKSGQGYRGRVYLGGLLQSHQSSPTAFDTAAGNLAAAFVQGINTATGGLQLPLGVARHALAAGTHHDGTPWEARPSGIDPVTAVEVTNTRIDSQRRRLGR